MRSTKTIKWESLPAVHDRLDQVFSDWEGTPHRDRQQHQGVGCDCVRFVSAVLDEMSGTTTNIKTLPSDASWHNATEAWESLRAMLEAFPHELITIDDTLYPGDVVVVGPRSGGPGHVLMVGTANDMWHCGHVGVVRTGLGAVFKPKTRIMKVFRPDKRSW